MASLQLHNVWGRPGKRREKESIGSGEFLSKQTVWGMRRQKLPGQTWVGGNVLREVARVPAEGQKGPRDRSRGECLSTPSFLWCK